MTGPLPWMKFAPDRWQRDEALRMCGAAARGVWAELICIMHKAEPYGHLLIRGKQPTDRQLSVITGLSPLEIAQGLTQLEENEVFSRTSDGTVFCRGMVRDKREHDRLSQCGKKGQRVKQQKTQGKTGGLSHPLSHPLSTPSSLESEEEEESEKTLPSIPPKLGGPKTELPEEWEPQPFAEGSAAHRIESSWSEERRQSELDSFRSNHRRKGSRYSDWQDIWGGWIRNAEKFDNRDDRDRPARAASSAAPRSHVDIVLEEIEREERRQRAEQPQSRPKKRAGANQ